MSFQCFQLPPRMPCKPIYNLHCLAGGSPPCSFAASNVPRSGEACNSQQESGIPFYKCGFKKAYHEHGRVAHLSFSAHIIAQIIRYCKSGFCYSSSSSSKRDSLNFS